MFYRAESPNKGPVYALLSLTPSESKRLIAKGVAAIPEIKNALKKGTIIVSRGITNAFIAEELTGQKIEPKSTFSAGMVAEGELLVTDPETRRNIIILQKGKIVEGHISKLIMDFSPEDIFIKGASAIDPQGNSGVLVSGTRGGTIGDTNGILAWRGAFLLAPVGLEKLVPSVQEAAANLGINRFKYSTGRPVSMIEMPNAHVFTEIQALQVLFGVSPVMAAGGGNSGSEGSVILSVAGTEAAIEEMMILIKQIKGEPPVKLAGRGSRPAVEFNYDAKTQFESGNK